MDAESFRRVAVVAVGAVAIEHLSQTLTGGAIVVEDQTVVGKGEQGKVNGNVGVEHRRQPSLHVDNVKEKEVVGVAEVVAVMVAGLATQPPQGKVTGGQG